MAEPIRKAATDEVPELREAFAWDLKEALKRHRRIEYITGRNTCDGKNRTCKINAHWEFVAHKNATVSKAGTYCWTHLFEQFGDPAERRSFTDWMYRQADYPWDRKGDLRPGFK